VRAAEMAAKEMGQLSLIDALALVACYARTGSPEVRQGSGEVAGAARGGAGRIAAGHSPSSRCA
jgi:hypothetical protein